jgi:hypothetical protein
LKTILSAISFMTLALATTCVFSQTSLNNGSDNDTPRQTPAGAAQSKAEWAAAKARWAALTPDEKATVRRNAQQKRWDEPSAIEMISDNDTEMLTSDQTAQLKRERLAAQAKWAAMSPDEKAAMRKAIRQKRLANMTELEKVAGSRS